MHFLRDNKIPLLSKRWFESDYIIFVHNVVSDLLNLMSNLLIRKSDLKQHKSKFKKHLS